MFELRSVIESAASTDAEVLLHGESSRMCELVARAIHESSGHRAFSRMALRGSEWVKRGG
ncbi:MAG: sigma 54-interacting transcriptional regulator [Candidatus Rokuibacteriota bacterium]